VVRLWFEFAVLTGVIVAAGTALSRYGDVLAEKSGMGRTWIGLILIAVVTSMPELFSGIGAVTIAEAPDIAVGSVMGSCVFNMTLLVLIDALHRRDSLYHAIGAAHILSAALGLGLIAFVGLAIVAARLGLRARLGPVGLVSPGIVVFYLMAARAVFRFEQRRLKEIVEQAEMLYGDVPLRRAVIGFSAASVVVVAASLALPVVAERLAQAMGWSRSFVGTILVAATTSMPELVVTVAAARQGALDLAVGNIFGSNLFNMAIIALVDPFDVGGPILDHVALLHTISAFTSVLMKGVVIAALVTRQRTRAFAGVSWISLLLVGLFLINSLALYFLEE